MAADAATASVSVFSLAISRATLANVIHRATRRSGWAIAGPIAAAVACRADTTMHTSFHLTHSGLTREGNEMDTAHRCDAGVSDA
jgi:hypothetical protein